MFFSSTLLDFKGGFLIVRVLILILFVQAPLVHASFCEDFLSGRAHYSRTSRAWKVCDPVCDVDVSRIGDHYPDITPSSMVLHAHTFYDGRTWPPSEKIQDAETYTFHIPLSANEIHQIEITIANQDVQKAKDTNALYAISIIKALPIKTCKATHRIEVINRDVPAKYRGTGFKMLSGKASAFGSIFTENYGDVLSDEFTQLILHEHAHNVAGYISSEIEPRTFPPYWNKVVSADQGRFVSDYAKTNFSEDFAETFSVYLTTRGTELESFRRKYSARSKTLDLLFSEQHGGLKAGSSWII